MTYDVDLAARVRALLADEPEATERAMFGGLAFLVAGAMAVAANAAGALMVRIDPDDPAADLAQPVVMRGRPLRGWVEVDARVLDDDGVLAEWVGRGVERARALARS